MDLSIPDYSWREAKKIDCPFEFKLKTFTYPTGITKIVMTRIKRTIQDIKEGDYSTEYKPSAEELEQKRLENIRRSSKRAKQAVEHAIRSMGADHMLTLTTRENITDRDNFYEVVTRFIRLVRSKDYKNGALVTRKQKRDWQYVGVDELQDRGAYHMHIACCGKQNLHLLRACWYVALGGNPSDKKEYAKGQIDVQYRDKRFGGQSETHQVQSLVRYMCKYMTKSFDVDSRLGINRYKRAHSIKKPIVNEQFLWTSFANNDGDFSKAVSEVYAIADFLGLRELEPWNPNDDIFILIGVEQ